MSLKSKALSLSDQRGNPSPRSQKSPRSPRSQKSPRQQNQQQSTTSGRRRSAGELFDLSTNSPSGRPQSLNRQLSFSGITRGASFKGNMEEGSDTEDAQPSGRSNRAGRRSSKSKKQTHGRKRVSFSDPLIDPRPEVQYVAKRGTSSKSPEPEGDDSLVEDETIDQTNSTKPNGVLKTGQKKKSKIVPVRVKRKYRRRKSWWRRYLLCANS